MRMTDIPVLEEIKDEYMQLRREGNGRSEATMKLQKSYIHEITEGAADDGLLFWIGLADAQYARKELETEIAERASAALDRLEKLELGIAIGDLQRRRKHYAQAPMTEKKVGKPRPRFQCAWNVGDTFAYRIQGEEAQAYNLAGRYALFRTLEVRDIGDGRCWPVVSVTIWDKEPLPQNSEEFQSVPMLIVNTGGRCNSPKDKFEYRMLMIIKNRKQLDGLALQYVGNFQDVAMPEEEIIFEHPAFLTMIPIERIDREICIRWKMNLYCTQGKME